MPNPIVTVGTSPQKLIDKTDREAIVVTNLSSTADLFVGWDANPSNVTNASGATPGTLVPPRASFRIGATFQQLRAQKNEIWLVASAAGTPVAWQSF